MRRYLLAAVAAAAIASPAMARDGSPYVGIEGGIMYPEDSDFDVTVNDGGTETKLRDAFTVDFRGSLDADLLAGYDFGLVRLEGELGYKRLRTKDVTLSSLLAGEIDASDDDFDGGGRGSVLSLMANALLDFGDENGYSAYVGGGAGRARVKFSGERDSTFAWQIIAGVRKAISPNVDLGLKYRYFRTGKINYSDSFDDGETVYGLGASGKLRTHSLLASLIFNFNAPPPPPAPVIETPPPPPPPPATQTCYDGSVILATDVCPQPPVETPPPPPEPMPERG